MSHQIENRTLVCFCKIFYQNFKGKTLNKTKDDTINGKHFHA